MPTILMTAAAIKPQVDRAYGGTHAFQWVREAYVNSDQAGARKIEFTTEPQGVVDFDVHRRMIVDDGCGMDPDEIAGFMNKFGGSGKSIGATYGNYGYGCKVSLLPWNHHGLVVISRGAAGALSLIWMHLDVDHDDYGARMFDLNAGTGDDPDWSDVVPLDEFDAWDCGDDTLDWKQVGNDALGTDSNGHPCTGTVLVLMGNGPDQDTVRGDPSREEFGKYDIVQYLNGRLWEVNLDTEVAQYEFWSNRAKWPTQIPQKQIRRPHGLRSVLEGAARPTALHPGRGIEASGTLTLSTSDSGMKVDLDWTLFKEPTLNRGDLVSLPLIGVLFEAHPGLPEVFDLHAAGMNGIGVRARMSRFVKVSDVQDRLALIIRPQPKAVDSRINVFPDASRTRLLYTDPKSGGKDLPWDEWVTAWQNHMPTEVKKAIADHYSALATTAPDEESVRLLGQRYLPFLRQTVTRLVRSLTPTGLTGATKTGIGGTGTPGVTRTGPVTERLVKPATRIRSRRPTHPADSGGDQDLKESSVRGALVQVVAESRPDQWYGVTYDPAARIATVNTASESYLRVMNYMLDKESSRGRITDDAENPRRRAVTAAIHDTIVMHVRLAMTETVVESNAHPDERDEILADPAVSTCLRGIRNIEEMASGPIGAALKGKRLAA